MIEMTKAKAKPAKTSDGACTPVHDVLVQIADELETLSQKKAFALADDLIAEKGFTDFRLGGVLAVIHDKTKTEGNEEWLDGREDFKELCLKRFGFRYRKAMYLISIYKHLVDQKIPWKVIEPLRWSKLRVLAAKKAITAKNAASWVEKAEKLTVEELEASLGVGGDGKKSKTTTFKFKAYPDQEEAIRAALDKAKEESDTEYDAVALHNIAHAYLGNAVEMEAKVEEKPKHPVKLRLYWQERLLKVYDGMRGDLGDDDALEEAVNVAGEVWPKATIKVEMP